MNAVFSHSLLMLTLLVSIMNTEWNLSVKFDGNVDLSAKIYRGLSSNGTNVCTGTWSCLDEFCGRDAQYTSLKCFDSEDVSDFVAPKLHKTVVAFSILIALFSILCILFQVALYSTQVYSVFVVSWAMFETFLVFSAARVLLMHAFIEKYNAITGDKMPDVELGAHLASCITLVLITTGEHCLILSEFEKS